MVCRVYNMSRSLRARGLKLYFLMRALTASMSRSLRARGLKSVGSRPKRRRSQVALFTGAWIEIFFKTPFSNLTGRRALYGRVD